GSRSVDSGHLARGEAELLGTRLPHLKRAATTDPVAGRVAASPSIGGPCRLPSTTHLVSHADASNGASRPMESCCALARTQHARAVVHGVRRLLSGGPLPWERRLPGSTSGAPSRLEPRSL